MSDDKGCVSTEMVSTVRDSRARQHKDDQRLCQRRDDVKSLCQHNDWSLDHMIQALVFANADTGDDYNLVSLQRIDSVSV